MAWSFRLAFTRMVLIFPFSQLFTLFLVLVFIDQRGLTVFVYNFISSKVDSSKNTKNTNKQEADNIRT